MSQPPSAQSEAEMRTHTGSSAGHCARMPVTTSRNKRVRPSKSPPYSSVRKLVSGVMKADKLRTRIVDTKVSFRRLEAEEIANKKLNFSC